MEEKVTAMEQRHFQEVDRLNKLLEASDAKLQTEVAAAAAAHEAANAAANVTKAAQAQASLLEEKLSQQVRGNIIGHARKNYVPNMIRACLLLTD